MQEEFRGPSFRLYGSDDVVGVEIGAALKNIIAIAAGVVESLSLGHNAMAALITRGLAEISRLACAMGGRRETLAGLSGLGDLVLTCTGSLSRNRHVGIELGRGRPLDEILAGMRMVAEGVRTTTAALALGARHGVELPIAEQMAEVLAGRKTPREAVGDLMLRPQRGEHDGRRAEHGVLFRPLRAGLAKTAQQIRERLGEPDVERAGARAPAPAAGAGREPSTVDSIEALEDALIARRRRPAGHRAHPDRGQGRSARASLARRASSASCCGILTDVPAAAG